MKKEENTKGRVCIGSVGAGQHQDVRNIQRKRSLKKDAQRGTGGGGRGGDLENIMSQKLEKFFLFLRKSKWLRVSNVPEKSRQIIT